MGWSITLKSNQKIEHETAKKIVESLPQKLRGPWESMGRRMDQAVNGWSAACDVNEPEEKEWRIGGSYGMSGHVAEEMAEHLRKELEKRSHKIKIITN